MRKLLVILLAFAGMQAASQSIKMKIASLTAAAGEEVSALQMIDSLSVNIGSTGSGSNVGRTYFNGVDIKKITGPSSIQLFQKSITGAVLPEVAFEFYDASNTLYYKIVLKDVYTSLFSHLSPECSGCAKLYNQIRFEPIKYEVTDVLTNTTYRYNVSTRTTY